MLHAIDFHIPAYSITAYSLLAALGNANEPAQFKLYCYTITLIDVAADFAIFLR